MHREGNLILLYFIEMLPRTVSPSKTDLDELYATKDPVILTIVTFILWHQNSTWGKLDCF